MNYHTMNVSEVEKSLNTNLFEGLTEQEAKKRLEQYGYNELEIYKKQSDLWLFFRQFKDFLVIILLVAVLISLFLGEYADAITILTIVIINAFLGFFQERKAERALEALQKLSAPQVNVLRNGEWMKIPSRELVPGDVIRFSSGDRIGADVRIMESISLEIEESPLTGESVPVEKTTDPLDEEEPGIGDMRNMAFMGTLVTRGSGKGIVVGTGMETEMGKISGLMQKAAQSFETLLQRRLKQLGKILIVVAALLTILIVVIGVIQDRDLYTMLLTGVSLAVAAIPEGLPAIVTIVLSLGVTQMIKKNAIVRKLPAVETLGTATVICSDKTGTMTQNKMTVTHLWIGGKTWTVDGSDYSPKGAFYHDGSPVDIQKEPVLLQMLMYGMLCNHAEVRKKGDEYVLDGSPTEGAMLVAAMKAGFDRHQLLVDYTVLQEFPFDSARKMMSMIVKDPDGKQLVIAKGAPDVLANVSSHIIWDGKAQPLTFEMKKSLRSAIDDLNSRALRTMAIAYKELPPDVSISGAEEAESGLTFMGLEGMIDPPRPEVKEAVEECKKAGIKTIMITGDHLITAKAIAAELGIYQEDSMIIDGRTLAKMSVEELEKVVEDVAVFARVSPEHKLKIVNALQRKGHIVAMTGDGVNDAPAIKAADIGISMGITGTDVAKESSSLILLDDNFATIKAAIQEGRNIYENIRKFIRYLLASNVGEMLVMIFAIICALPLPLIPIHILWVNLITDGLPAMALGVDQPEEDLMKSKPRDPKEGIFARGLGWKVISRGLLIGIVTLAVFLVTLENHPDDLVYAQTAAFASLVMAQLIHVFDCRSNKSVFSRNPFGNRYLVWAVSSSLVLMLIVIYIPALQPIFSTAPIRLLDWLFILLMASIPTILPGAIDAIILKRKYN
ncbi:cation-translocating P-type ATPase [Ureibacillus sp. FSL K6-8385]|uniref:P-type Ca(2+) transporter n=1 Tax=Ureibacillus terrenus TaxID=118246 RepID=A0A540V510_9BACL|nr:cation-translocating P-type ATPase [Ureibacillus terrenus]MED3661468.1 cation-translocating P-type ATPase [Ureibacillus terrenus]MED3763935.1 cation-translocating P-type ATPase [Ureibacillus terrenus]TQE91840.1 cation-translocating P-type ATPase [Ureibacillus terrenus]